MLAGSENLVRAAPAQAHGLSLPGTGVAALCYHIKKESGTCLSPILQASSHPSSATMFLRLGSLLTEKVLKGPSH